MSTKFNLGVYVGNPNGNDAGAEASFEAQFNSFVADMGGAQPQFMNAFIDFSHDPSTWAGNAGWTAWSWTQSKVVGHADTPVIGIPMSDTAHWAGNPAGSTNDDFFKTIIAGGYDADYKGIVDAWANNGFKTMDLRLGYEMDGNYMPWYVGDDPNTLADWVKAFQHLSVLMKAEAKADGVTANIVWNPNDTSWTTQAVLAQYPGDQYVDIVSSDVYSPQYPWGYYDWAKNDGTVDPNFATWDANPINREHYWSYPTGSQYNPTGTPNVGWGLEDLIALAKAHNKPIAISETGDGGNGTTTGPVDDPAFPQWLASELSKAQAQGVTVSFVNIWDIATSEGNWDFTSAGSTKPQTALAWSQYFGAASAPAAQPAPPVAVVTLTDWSGHSLTQSIITSGSTSTYAGQSGLLGNVYQWTWNGLTGVATDSFGQQVVSMNLIDTAGRSLDIWKIETSNVEVGGATSGTLSEHMVAGGTITFDAGTYLSTLVAQAGWGATQAATAALNTFTIAMTTGNDTVSLDGSGTWNNTSAVVQAGSGNDALTFIAVANITETGGIGTARSTSTGGHGIYTAGAGSLEVRGGSGADTYVFHNGAGVLTVDDFAAAKGDLLQIDSSLKASLQQSTVGANTVLSFGSAAHEIVLVGMPGSPANLVHWT